MSKQTELERLRAFAQDVMKCWPEGDVDGGYLQELAIRHGLLTPTRVNEPCGEGCRCAEDYTEKEWNEGVTCYRKTALLIGG